MGLLLGEIWRLRHCRVVVRVRARSRPNVGRQDTVVGRERQRRASSRVRARIPDVTLPQSTHAAGEAGDRPPTDDAPPPAPSEAASLTPYQYWIALMALVLVSVGFGAISPSLSDILAELGVGASLGALLVAALGAGRLIGGFPSSIVVGRIGPSMVVLLGCGVFIIGSTIAWLAPTFAILAFGRLVQGISLGIVPAGVLAGMMMGTRAERAGGSMALYQSGLTLGGAIGPAVGGPLADAFGWRSALLFCVWVGIVSLVLCLPLAFSRRKIPATPAKRRERLGWSAAAAVAIVLAPHIVTFLYRSGVGQLALPLYASGPAGLDASTVGLLLGSQAAMSLVMLGPAGWATNRFGVRPVLAAALIAASTGVALIPISPAPYGLWAATILFGGGLATLGVSSGLFVFTLAGYSTGALVGVYRLSGDIVQVGGPILVGPLLDSVGYTAGFLIMAACGYLALLSLAFQRKPKPPALDTNA
jgi:MFS family permease